MNNFTTVEEATYDIGVVSVFTDGETATVIGLLLLDLEADIRMAHAVADGPAMIRNFNHHVAK